MEIIKTITEKESDKYGNHQYFIKLESGKSGFYRSKNECQFKPGEEVDFIIEEKTKKDNSGTYLMFKLNKPDFKGGFNKRGSNASFALSYSKDIEIALINKELSDVVTLEANIIQRANVFLKWLNKNG